jgi:hypothetical protein
VIVVDIEVEVANDTSPTERLALPEVRVSQIRQPHALEGIKVLLSNR